MASPAPRKTHRYATPRQSVTPPRQRRMVSARPAGTPSRRTEDIAAVQDVMDVDDVQMYNERVLGSGRETLYARTDEISVAFHAALPFEVRRELKGAGASIVLNSTQPSTENKHHRTQISILNLGPVQLMPSRGMPLLCPRTPASSGITPNRLHVTSSRVHLPLKITHNRYLHHSMLSFLPGHAQNLVWFFFPSAVTSVSGTA
jgi:hypothetical protein